jgi:hypothetical protein
MVVIFGVLMTEHHAFEPRTGRGETGGTCGRCEGRGWVVVRHGQASGVPEWRPCAVCAVDDGRRSGGSGDRDEAGRGA